MVKPGYKQTSVGIIPQDWAVSKLGNAFPKLYAGASVNSEIGTTSEYYVLKTSAVHDGKVDMSEIKPVIKADYGRVKCPVAQGSIIISRMNTPDLVGECGYVKAALANVYLPDRLWQIFYHDNSEYSFLWLNYLLNTETFRDAIRATATGTSNSMKNIAKERLLKIDIPKPQLDEQRRISKVLSDVDDLIASLEKLIAKRKTIKQGAMQELLTGKKRLPGFSGEWKSVKLRERGCLLGESINPQAAPNTYYWEYSMPAFDEGKCPTRQLGSDMHSNRIVISGNVLLFNKLNVRQKRIWLVDNCRSNSICSSEFLPYCSKTVDLRLLSKILFTDKVTMDFIGMSTGTSNSQKRITPNDFMDYEIYLPVDKGEQNALADIFDDIENEIIKLEQKLTKYRQVKQGMMQQLLTGKIRLMYRSD